MFEGMRFMSFFQSDRLPGFNISESVGYSHSNIKEDEWTWVYIGNGISRGIFGYNFLLLFSRTRIFQRADGQLDLGWFMGVTDELVLWVVFSGL